jgi:hypothetical protein
MWLAVAKYFMGLQVNTAALAALTFYVAVHWQIKCRQHLPRPLRIA